MRKQTEQNNEPQSTVWPLDSNSCGRCFNKPLQEGNTGMTAPRLHGTYISVPVMIEMPDGKPLTYCYISRCPICGHIKNYDARYLYQKGSLANFYPLSWEVTRKYRIDPEKVVDAVLKTPRGTVWLKLSEVQFEGTKIYGGKYD